MDNNNNNELLQHIGQLYVDAKRLQFIVQQRENVLAQQNKEINKLKSELAGLTKDTPENDPTPNK